MAYFALLGLIGIAICMPIYQMSINFTESSVVAVLFSCNPVFVTFFAFMILKEPIKRRHLAALSLEILGTLAIINPLHIKLNMVGVGLALCSTVLFSIYGVMGKRKCAEYGGAVVTCFSFLFGSVIIFCFILITHIPAVAGFFQSIGLPSFAQIPILEGYTLQNLPYVLYVSAGVAGVGFCAYFLAMEYQPASVVSLVYFFKPALSPILAWMVHGEEIPGNMLAGILLIMGSKRQRRRDVGRIMMGFAILMYGMELMSGAVSPLAEMPQFAGLLTAFENPLLGVLVGAVFTGIIQSSAASVAILQALAMTGSITYGMAIPIIMGQNIGTCVTALISSIGVNRNAKRVAVVHISFNVIGTAVCLILFYGGDMILHFTFLNQAVGAVGIAFCHTAFNVFTTILLLPFSRQLEKLARRLVRTEDTARASPSWIPCCCGPPARQSAKASPWQAAWDKPPGRTSAWRRTSSPSTAGSGRPRSCRTRTSWTFTRTGSAATWWRSPSTGCPCRICARFPACSTPSGTSSGSATMP